MPVAVTGLKETVKNLERLGVEVDDLKDVFSALAREAAEINQNAAPRRSGKLQASVRGNRAKNKAVVSAGGARVPYARLINYGNPKRNIRPRYFMQEADRILGPRLDERLEQGLSEVIRKAGFE